MVFTPQSHDAYTLHGSIFYKKRNYCQLKFYIAERQILCFFAAVTLTPTPQPSYMNLTHIDWRYLRRPNELSTSRLSKVYRITYIQTDMHIYCHRNYYHAALQMVKNLAMYIYKQLLFSVQLLNVHFL